MLENISEQHVHFSYEDFPNVHKHSQEADYIHRAVLSLNQQLQNLLCVNLFGASVQHCWRKQSKLCAFNKRFNRTSSLIELHTTQDVPAEVLQIPRIKAFWGLPNHKDVLCCPLQSRFTDKTLLMCPCFCFILFSCFISHTISLLALDCVICLVNAMQLTWLCNCICILCEQSFQSCTVVRSTVLLSKRFPRTQGSHLLLKINCNVQHWSNL